MDIRKMKQLAGVLKIATFISFLCIFIDNGKFEVPMVLLLLAPLTEGIIVGYTTDVNMQTILHDIAVFSHSILLVASLTYIFVTTALPLYTKFAKKMLIVAMLFLWVRLILSLPGLFTNLSYRACLTHGIFIVLSSVTLFFILKIPIDKKIKPA